MHCKSGLLFSVAAYVGFLEILAAAYIYRKQFQIYVVDAESSGCYKLLCALPPALFQKSNPVCLLHRIDTSTKPGHFDLLIDKRVLPDCEWSSWNDQDVESRISFPNLIDSMFAAVPVVAVELVNESATQQMGECVKQ